MHVSVVIPCHDVARTLPLQLEALSRQVGAPEFEVVLADNRSTDGLPRLAEQWGSRLPRLVVVSADDRPGAAYARNVGGARARGERLLFCDGDDVVARDWVAQGSAALESAPVANGVDVTLPEDAFTTVDDLWSGHLDRATRTPVEVAPIPQPYPVLLGGNLAIRRDTFMQVGGYDASLTSANEDNDLGIRLARTGTPISRAPGMWLAIRRRAGAAAVFRRARAAGRGHLQLCHRYDLWQVSPYLSGRTWRLDPVRVAAAAAKQVRLPAGRRDWEAVAERAGAGLGAWQGDLQARRGREAPPAVGVGLSADRGGAS